jgi:hypothetical protein
MQEIDVMTIPSEEHVIKLIKDAFKIKAVYVAFTIWHPSEDEDVHSLTIIVYSKEEKTISKSPFRIVSNKLVPVQKQEKGFHIFMEDEGE